MASRGRDRQCRPATAAQGGATWTTFRDVVGRVLSEAGTGGAVSGLRVTNTFDAFGRRTGLVTGFGTTNLTAHDYTFDAAGRLDTAADGGVTATYSYLVNSGWAGQITFARNGAERMVTTRQYHLQNRLSSVASQSSASGAVVSSFDYSYNDANQRTRVDLADGSFWNFGLGG